MLRLTTLVNGAREIRPLEDGAWFIGRGPHCRVRLDFPDVSERHALLTVSRGVASIKDLRSANGTYVNGEPLTDEVQLGGGDVVQIGESLLRVSNEDVEERAPESAPEDRKITRLKKRPRSFRKRTHWSNPRRKRIRCANCGAACRNKFSMNCSSAWT